MVQKLPIVVMTIVIILFSAIILGSSINQRYDSTNIIHTQYDYLLH